MFYFYYSFSNPLYLCRSIFIQNFFFFFMQNFFQHLFRSWSVGDEFPQFLFFREIIPLSILKDDFVRQNSRLVMFFSFNTQNIQIHSPLPCMVSDLKGVYCNPYPCSSSGQLFYSLGSFKIFFFFSFSILDITSLKVCVCVLTFFLLHVLWALQN